MRGICPFRSYRTGQFRDEGMRYLPIEGLSLMLGFFAASEWTGIIQKACAVGSPLAAQCPTPSSHRAAHILPVRLGAAFTSIVLAHRSPERHRDRRAGDLSPAFTTVYQVCRQQENTLVHNTGPGKINDSLEGEPVEKQICIVLVAVCESGPRGADGAAGCGSKRHQHCFLSCNCCRQPECDRGCSGPLQHYRRCQCDRFQGAGL